MRFRQAAAVKPVFGATSNHDEGFAPVTGQRLAERLGMKIVLPDGAASDAQMNLL